MNQPAIEQKLKTYVNVGILQEIDLEMARLLADMGGTDEDEITLAVVLTSYSFRQGNVCLSLAEYENKKILAEEVRPDQSVPEIVTPPLDTWRQKLVESPHVGRPDDFKPLIIDDKNRLYLHKLWYYERLIGDKLFTMSNKKISDIEMDVLRDGLERYFPSENLFDLNWQQVAAALSVLQQFSVISGGPGTGKTTTVVRILALLLEQAIQSGKNLSIAMSAPTGKAAARLKESVQQQKHNLPAKEEIRGAIPDLAMTLHQLLGARRAGGFRYSKDNPLPYDIVVIDEASMVDLTMMAKLLDALPSDTRLILLGDKDQLASVEAGSVLGDICFPDENRYSDSTISVLQNLGLPVPNEMGEQENTGTLIDNITFLEHSYRFGADSGIGRLAQAINRGDATTAKEILGSEKYSDVQFNELAKENILDSLFPELLSHAKELAKSKDHAAAVDRLKKQIVLCVHRRGNLGSEQINTWMEKLLRRELNISKYEQWYAGRPILITRNDYTLKLRNGDLGIVWKGPNQDTAVFFEGEEREFRTINPVRLSHFENAYALTVHKSQGSEFDEVHIILPAESSPILTRELLYTAITRARKKVTLWGNLSVLKDGVEATIRRSSGLRERLWG